MEDFDQKISTCLYLNSLLHYEQDMSTLIKRGPTLNLTLPSDFYLMLDQEAWEEIDIYLSIQNLVRCKLILGLIYTNKPQNVRVGVLNI